MKRIVKRGLKVTWRWTAPLRRPILRKVEGFLRHCLRPLEPEGAPEPITSETDVLMDHMLRELVRLQCQVEALEQAVLEALPAPDDAAIAGGIAAARTLGEQLKAG